MLIKGSLKWDKSCVGGSWCVEYQSRIRKTRKVLIEISVPMLGQRVWKWKRKGAYLKACFKFRNLKHLGGCLVKVSEVLGSWSEVVETSGRGI